MDDHALDAPFSPGAKGFHHGSNSGDYYSNGVDQPDTMMTEVYPTPPHLLDSYQNGHCLDQGGQMSHGHQRPILGTKDSLHGSNAGDDYSYGVDQTDTAPLFQQIPPHFAQAHNKYEKPFNVGGQMFHGHQRPILGYRMIGAEDRWKTYLNWPKDNPVHPTDLAAAGFVYTGPADTVQCVFCNGRLRNFEPEDTAIGEHQRHFPRCQYVCEFTRDRNVYYSALEHLKRMQMLLPIARHEKKSTEHAFFQQNSEHYNGSSALVGHSHLNVSAHTGIVSNQIPARPEMSSLSARLATYNRWPPGIKQRPQVMAEAGFFYLGVNDSVKCYFCDGGLCNWQPEDDPWAEHQTWFPQCQHVVEHFGKREGTCEKGNDLSTAAELKTLGKPHTEPMSGAANGAAVEKPTDNHLPTAQKRKIDMNKPYIKAAIGVIDCSENYARKAIKRYVKQTGKEFDNAAQFLDFLFDMEDKAMDTDSSDSDTEAKPTLKNIDDDPVPALLRNGHVARGADDNEPRPRNENEAELLRLENQRLKDEKICKVCMDADVSVVILPCGHLVCCGNCAPALTKCPICRVDIRGTVKTYMS